MQVLHCVNNILMSLPHMLTLEYLVPSSKSSAGPLELIPTGSPTSIGVSRRRNESFIATLHVNTDVTIVVCLHNIPVKLYLR